MKLLSFFLLGGILAAQTPQALVPVPSPIEVIGEKAGAIANGMQDVELQCRNVSAKTIVIYSIDIVAKVNGKQVDHLVKMYLTTNANRSGIAPGAMISIPITHQAADGAVVFESKVIWAVFADKTSFGRGDNPASYISQGDLSGYL